VNTKGADSLGSLSASGARPVDPQWITDIREQCLDADVPFFFKQWGGVHKKKFGRTLDGRTWDQMPVNSELVVLHA
jgi:protein gp37